MTLSFEQLKISAGYLGLLIIQINEAHVTKLFKFCLIQYAFNSLLLTFGIFDLKKVSAI